MSQGNGTSPAAGDAKAASSRTAAEQVGYVLSLPERALRGGTGLLGGVMRESASLLVPQSFQSSRTYTVMVQQMLDFLVHDVGGVAAGDKASSTAEVDNYVARRAIGNFVDMASLATLHLSPLVLLAAVSDVAYGSQVYLKELADELKAQGVIAEDSTIDHVNDLLTAVSDASAASGKAFNTPPLSVDALRNTINETRAAIGAANPVNVLPQAEIRRMGEDMREIARKEDVGLLAVSGAATMHAMGQVCRRSGRGQARIDGQGRRYTSRAGSARARSLFAGFARYSAKGTLHFAGRNQPTLYRGGVGELWQSAGNRHGGRDLGPACGAQVRRACAPIGCGTQKACR